MALFKLGPKKQIMMAAASVVLSLNFNADREDESEHDVGVMIETVTYL